jgi:hypothetical protein
MLRNQRHLSLDRTSVAAATDTAALPAATPAPHRPLTTPDQQVGELGPAILTMLGRIAVALETLGVETHRLADHVAPAPGDVVGTPYLAKKLACTVVWAAEMARNGQIPKGCVVPGTGNGKPWKFYRRRIEEWINKR